MHPFQVIEVDEIKQIITLSTYTVITWQLNNSLWNKTLYNATDIKVNSQDMWTPSIVMPQACDYPLLEIPEHVNVEFSGEVEVPILSRRSVFCYLDLTLFPFDEHICDISFEEMYDYTIEIDNESNYLTRKFGKSAEWIIQDHGCDKNKLVTCWFRIKRRSIFYTVVIITPIIFMSYMTLIVFLLPPDGGEKISFVVSIFVSLTVFTNFVVDFIPRSTDQLPRMVYLITFAMVKTGLVALATAHVIKCHNNRTSAPEVDNNEADFKEEQVKYANRESIPKNAVFPIKLRINSKEYAGDYFENKMDAVREANEAQGNADTKAWQLTDAATSVVLSLERLLKDDKALDRAYLVTFMVTSSIVYALILCA